MVYFFAFRPSGLAPLAAAALIALGALAPGARADDAGAGATCPAGAQRGHLAGAPAQLEEIQRRIAAEMRPGEKIVVLSNGGYSYGSPQPGADAAIVELEAKDSLGHAAPR